MTESGTFVINGAERAIVSQLVRSPGAYYGLKIEEKTGKKLFNSTIIPNRGAWLEYETDLSDVLYVRIDKNRKLPLTTFIRSLGVATNEQIRQLVGDEERIAATFDKDTTTNVDDALIEVYKKLRPGEPATVDGAQNYISQLFFDERRYDLSRVGRYKYNKKLSLAARLTGKVLSRAIVDDMTGEILAEPDEMITKERALEFEAKGVSEAYVKVEDTAAGIVRELKILTNGMVDINNFVSFDTKALGVNEQVSFRVLKEILQNNTTEEEISEAI
jgi:DNA-directed RNA polymerase subunit beta